MRRLTKNFLGIWGCASPDFNAFCQRQIITEFLNPEAETAPQKKTIPIALLNLVAVIFLLFLAHS